MWNVGIGGSSYVITVKPFTQAKANGVHYTPHDLAAFLAEQTVGALKQTDGPLRILDPACGDGELLEAFFNATPVAFRSRLILEGFETDPKAWRRARRRLAGADACKTCLINGDFLSERTGDEMTYDVVIANPPYVRTQVLGAAAAQRLAARFGLSGRVDLYHAFTIGMARVLKPAGVLGLLTSNRFLTIKSGSTLRRLLRDEFELLAIHDLGDTRLFTAAVLPAILIARKGKEERAVRTTFDRIYHQSSNGDSITRDELTVLDALRDRQVSGVINTVDGLFRIQRGTLAIDDDHWTLTTAEAARWLKTVRSHQAATFGEMGQVRVGIKTTADDVFIRDDWDELPTRMSPESRLLRPLLTHVEASRWVARAGSTKKVLYPHEIANGRRVAVDLKEHPRAAAYLKSNRAQLSRRHYLIDSGRKWYEIWVPHQPHDWSRPKIVCPDISESSRFFLDTSGAVVNGDCYWITLKPDSDPDWLWLILAVANSSFTTEYYDAVFHNKLYAGRRRFMTQYVMRFPLPDVRSKLGMEIVERTQMLVASRGRDQVLEHDLDELVWKAFGLRK